MKVSRASQKIMPAAADAPRAKTLSSVPPGIMPQHQVTDLNAFGQIVGQLQPGIMVIGSPSVFVPTDTIIVDGQTIKGVHERLQEGTISFAKDDEGRTYHISVELFDDPKHAEDIYRFERDDAISSIENCPGCKSDPNYLLEKSLFKEIERNVLGRISTRKMRHLSFLLKKASDIGCGFLTASAIMLHSMSQPALDIIIKNTVKALIKRDKLSRSNIRKLEDATEIIRASIAGFQKINNMLYKPPKKKRKGYIMDFMNAQVKLSVRKVSDREYRGNWRSLLIFLVHTLSSLYTTRSEEDKRDISQNVVNHIVATQAERFGLRVLAEQLRNQAMRIYDREKYDEYERGIIKKLNMKSRREAEYYLDQIKRRLEELELRKEELKSEKFRELRRDYGIVNPLDYEIRYIDSRVKKPWGVDFKANFRGAKYQSDDKDFPSVYYMDDVLAARIVTKNRLKKGEALLLTQSALGGDLDLFNGFNLEQTEEKDHEFKFGEVTIKIKVIHVGVFLKGRQTLELQFVCEEDMHELEYGCFAHWSYKLEKMTGQKFDQDFLQKCAEVMDGHLAHDVAAVYDLLRNDTFVFTGQNGDGIDILHIPLANENTNLLSALQAFYQIYPHHRDRYDRVEIGKVWDLPNVNYLPVSPDKRHFVDGDMVRFRFTGKNHWDHPSRNGRRRPAK